MIYFVILTLTIFDAWATWLGVTQYGIEEGNALARMLFSWSVPLTCIIAVIFTAIMLSVIKFVQDRTKRKWICAAVWGLLTIKVVIAILHISWLTLL